VGHVQRRISFGIKPTHDDISGRKPPCVINFRVSCLAAQILYWPDGYVRQEALSVEGEHGLLRVWPIMSDNITFPLFQLPNWDDWLVFASRFARATGTSFPE
jgi:hypothetical protein